MPEPTTLPVGTPIWTDLATGDLAAARRFYSELFGWSVGEAAPEFGGYAMFTQDGKVIAGSGPTMDGGPAGWNTYVRTDDAAAVTRTVRDAGGTVLLEPMQVADAGTMAMFADPNGAHICVWQPDTHQGAQLFNEPVSMAWNELNTRGVDAAKTFYAAVFGWENSGEEYVQWQLDGRSIGGCIDIDSIGLPAEVPPHWLVYFAVASCDDVAARAGELGATVMAPPRDIPDMGRFAVLADPQGAVFAVFSS